MSKSNKCPIDSSSSNDKDFKHNHYPYHQHDRKTSHKKTENPLSHIRKYLENSDTGKSSKDNVELALEVEINESLKRVLTNADRNSSDLLDVTIIRPSDSDTTHETTVALYKDEVRDFISLVEQHHKHQAKEPCTKEKCKEYKCRNDINTEANQRQDTGKHLSHKTEGKKKEKDVKIEDNSKQVYATVNTYDNKLKQTLPCQNRDRNSDKPGTPCMCQHCGVVGVLVQSQKGPVAPFPPLEEPHEDYAPTRPPSSRTRESNLPRRNRRMMDPRRKRSLDQLDILREINTRIKMLEKRISLQEETAVPRDYLKHILQKVLTQYVKGNAAIDSKVKNNGTQYSVKNFAEVRTTNRNYTNPDKPKDVRNRSYQVHTVLEEHKNWIDYTRDKDNPSHEKIEDPMTNKDLYWFWGDEVVKPGCDLKTKILKLLDDKLPRRPQSERAHPERAHPERPPTTSTISRPPTSRQYFRRTDNAPTNFNEGGIKIECDDNTIFLDNVEHSIRNFNYLYQDSQLAATRPIKQEPISSKSPAPALPSNENKFSNLRDIPRQNYPFDLKKTFDDSIFKKSIEEQKVKLKDKVPPPVEEPHMNNGTSHSVTTDSKNSSNTAALKVKNIGRIRESGVVKPKEVHLEETVRLPDLKKFPVSAIRDNLNRSCFRIRKEDERQPGSVDIKFVNPKIKHWSEDSTTSEDRYMRHTTKPPEENLPFERKESLIYKLDFLKNLARNKCTEQSRVLNKIWSQAKSTAKSRKDAVYIKIPFKNVNAKDAQDNLIEMHLTLEELEAVVNSSKIPSSPCNVKVQSYRSSSDIDFGQRQHEELKYVNREMLQRRQLSAKGKNRERR